MSRLLSQDEVRALLQQPDVGEAATGEKESTSVTSYDFRDRERMPRTRMRYLQYLHDRFAQLLSLSLSAYLRNGTEVHLEQLQQSSSRGVLQTLPDPTAVYLADASEGGVVAFVLDNELALAFVDRLMGGASETKPEVDRPLTEIEQSVLQGLVETILTALTHAWAPILDVRLVVDVAETRPGLVTLEPPEEGRIILKFNVSMGSGDDAPSGQMRIVLPMAIANPLSTELARDFSPDRGKASLPSDQLARVEARLLRTPVPLSVDLDARGVTAGDLVRLKAGSILNLGRAVEEPAVVRVGGAAKFTAVLAVSDGQPAAEIRSVVSTE